MSYNSFFLFHSYRVIHGSLKYNNSFQKTLPWQLLSLHVLPDFTPALAVPRERVCHKLLVREDSEKLL